MTRKTIITIIATIVAALSAIVLTADEQGIVCQAFCGSEQ